MEGLNVHWAVGYVSLESKGEVGGKNLRVSEIYIYIYIYVYDSVVRREWQPPPVFLPGEFHTQRSLVVYSPWDCKELDKTEATNTFIFFQATLRRSPRKCVGREEPGENQCFRAQVKSCKGD